MSNMKSNMIHASNLQNSSNRITISVGLVALHLASCLLDFCARFSCSGNFFPNFSLICLLCLEAGFVETCYL